MTHLFSKNKAYTCKKESEVRMRRKLLYLLLGILLLFLLLDPKTAFLSSKNGLNLWFQTIMPSLLPFMILSNFLLSGQGIHRVLNYFSGLFRFLFGVSPYGGYALLLGLFCGYPMGAKLTADLYLSGNISHREAEYLLAVSNNPSPTFLTAYLLVGTLNRPDLAPACLAAVYGGFFLTCQVFRLADRRSKTDCAELSSCDYPNKEYQKETSPPLPFGKRIDASIMNGFTAITKLGGYILMFSILSGLLGKLFQHTPLLAALILGITEISTGVQQLAAIPLPFSLSCSLIFACTAFGGFSIAAQASSMIQASGLKLTPYLAGKCCCAVFTFVLCLLFFVIVL